MGRREQPIRPCSKSLQALASWLRSGREEAGLTYEQLAARTAFSPDTLARAVSGSSVPRNVKVVRAYAAACGLPEAEAERFWKLARRDEARAAGVLNGQRSGLHISVVKDFADLHSAIVEQYQNAGSPPLRTLDDRIGGHGRLPHSTVSRVLKGKSRPSRSFIVAFAEAVNVRRSELAEWGKAWDRADRDRRSTRSKRASRVQDDVQGRLTKHDPVTPRDLQLLMSDLESSTRREPGIKLLVIPEAEYSRTYGPASRMTRELLVDQAQRQGDLSCPRCHKPSFGYDDSQGWRAELCTDCTTPSTPVAATPSRPEPQDLQAPSERPQLPRRTPGRSWPPSGVSASLETLGTDVFDAVGQPPEVCCRLCRGFHGAYDGCRPAEQDQVSKAPGRAAVAPDLSECTVASSETVDGVEDLGAVHGEAASVPIDVALPGARASGSKKETGARPETSDIWWQLRAALPIATRVPLQSRASCGPDRGHGCTWRSEESEATAEPRPARRTPARKDHV
jgi:transcriptional regulator with XRE-family HTH domain